VASGISHLTISVDAHITGVVNGAELGVELISIAFHYHSTKPTVVIVLTVSSAGAAAIMPLEPVSIRVGCYALAIS